MTKPCIQDLPLFLTFRLSGREEKDERILRLARLLPGFTWTDGQAGVRVQMPLAEACNLRDLLLDIWSLINGQQGSALHLGSKILSDDIDLKRIFIITDCAINHDLAKDNFSYCMPSKKFNWGCLHLQECSPVITGEGSVRKRETIDKINLEIDKKHINLCHFFDESKIESFVEKFIASGNSPFAVTDKNREISIERESRNIFKKNSMLSEKHLLMSSNTYADVGGLENVIQSLREAVELQLKHPEVFVRLGITPHRGVLLYGPPGCGKTLLARAVAHESGAHFFAISGPELITKWHGESEDNLRKLFAIAQENQPAIVFFDEIDAIAQSRSSAETLRLDSRFTTQLLTLLDGIHGLGRIAVLATTNRLDLLDPALLRPGRFDRIIEIPPPDRVGRLKILQIHTRQLPLAKDVSLEAVADVLNQATGADIAYVVREAAYSGLRRGISLDAVLSETKQLQEVMLSKIVVCNSDFSFGLDCFKKRSSGITKSTNG